MISRPGAALLAHSAPLIEVTSASQVGVLDLELLDRPLQGLCARSSKRREPRVLGVSHTQRKKGFSRMATTLERALAESIKALQQLPCRPQLHRRW